jgi:hypothetical protein
MPTSPGCSVISSNCVVWQGPDIPCINLCTGDSITEIIQKLATELCELSLPNVDITSVDFKCLIEGAGTDPTVLADALQLIIDKHCELKDIVDAITPGSDPVVALPACLQSAGITSQPVSQYVLTVANKVCQNVTAITALQNDLADLEERVTDLESAIALINPNITLPTVNTSCLGGSTTAQLNIGLQTTITALCDLKTVLGTNAELISAISAQCVGLAAAPSLSGTGNMSDLPGWVLSPDSVADTIKNLWITICDLRGLVSDLETQVQPKCKDVDLDFEVAFSSDRSSATLQLFKYSDIPSTFINKPTSNVKFSDGTTTYTDTIDVVAMANMSGQNITYSMSVMGLDVRKTITVTVESNLTTPDGDCDKLKTKTYEYKCLIAAPTSISITPTPSSAIISWTAPNTAEPVIRYEYQILSSGGAVLRNGTVKANNVTLGALDPGVSYQFRVNAVFACGSSDYTNQNFSTACYQIQSTFAHFEPCIGGGNDENLGGEIRISAPAEQNVSFMITVTYWAPSFSSSCALTNTTDLFGVIPVGQTVGIINACSSGIVVPGGVVCSVKSELLNGCASGNIAGQTCASPTALTATII